MKTTFPHIGDFYVCLSAMLDELGLDPVIPPPTGQRALTLGTRYAPESACFPLKLNIGNLMEAFHLGADTVVMAGGSGPCRFGYYAQVERQVFKDLGIRVDFHILEPPQTHLPELLRSLCMLLGKRVSRIPYAFRIGWAKATACDDLAKASLHTRAHEKVRGSVSRWLSGSVKKVHEAGGIEDVRRTQRIALAELMHLVKAEIDRDRCVRIGVVGEIFMLMDSYANIGLEEKLGHLGAEVDRKIFITDWIRTHLFPAPLKAKHQMSAIDHARPYLNHFVGGDGIESVGYSAYAPSEGIDGIIHVLPFTCMPEIVARSVLPLVSRDKEIPVLSLSMDEHTADAGLQTRLEAFLDLIRTKKEAVL